MKPQDLDVNDIIRGLIIYDEKIGEYMINAKFDYKPGSEDDDKSINTVVEVDDEGVPTLIINDH